MVIKPLLVVKITVIAVAVVITTANLIKIKMVKINIGTKNQMIFVKILSKHAAIGVVRMKKTDLILHLTLTQGAAPNTNYLLIVIKSRQMKCLCIIN